MPPAMPAEDEEPVEGTTLDAGNAWSPRGDRQAQGQPAGPRGRAGQGDADRHHDPAAAGRGEVRAVGRRRPRPAGGDPRALHQGARGRPGAGTRSRNWNGSACLSRTTPRRRTPNCGLRRPSWWAGWRACSTGSRRRSPRSTRPGSTPWRRCSSASFRRAPLSRPASSLVKTASRSVPRHRGRRDPLQPGRKADSDHGPGQYL